MPRDAIGEVERRFGVALLEGYGLSEATVVSTLNPLDGPRKPGTVGLPVPGQQVVILDADDRPLPRGERGEAPDPRLGEVAVAFVQLRPGSMTTVGELVAHCQASLARFKVPTEVRLVADLPRNFVGKVSKPVLRARLAPRHPAQ